tara:strand:- start:392 stop:565 length:174 start_codon:yes stop_codon:yes gene_type:complete
MKERNLDKEDKSYLETNPVALRSKAKEVLEKAKKLEAVKVAAGKKWFFIDGKTQVLR